MGMRLASAFVDIFANDKPFRDDIAKTRKSIGEELASLTGAFAGVAAIGAAGVGFLKLAADAETTATAMNVVIKDIDKTTKLLAELDKFSVVTPFTPKEVREAGSALVAMKNATEDIPGILQTLGDAAAGSNIRLSDMTRIFNKIQIEGKLTQETFVQLGAAGPSVMFALQDSLGKTRDEVKKMQSQGKISFEIFAEALKTTTEEGGTFFDAMNQQSKTLNGLVSTLSGNLTAIGEAIGKRMMPAAKALLAITISMATGFMAFDAATNGAATATIVLTGAVIGLGLAFKIANKLGLALVRTMLVAALANPFGVVLLALGAIAIALSVAIGWVRKLQVVQDAWRAATIRLKDAWENVKAGLFAIFQAIQAAAITAFQAIAGALGIETGNMKDGFAGIIADIIDRVSTFALEASEWFRVFAENAGLAFELLKIAAFIAITFIKDVFMNLPQIAGFVGGAMAKKMSEAMISISEFVINTFSKVAKTVTKFFLNIGKRIKDAILGLDFGNILKQIAKEAANAIANIKKGALEGALGQDLSVKFSDVSAEQQRFNEIVDIFKQGKKKLEADRTPIVEEEVADAAEETVEKVKDALSKPLDLKFGFSGFADINKTLQDSLLKDTTADKTLGAIEIGNATLEEQNKLLKKGNDIAEENKVEIAGA